MEPVTVAIFCFYTPRGFIYLLDVVERFGEVYETDCEGLLVLLIFLYNVSECEYLLSTRTFRPKACLFITQFAVYHISHSVFWQYTFPGIDTSDPVYNISGKCKAVALRNHPEAVGGGNDSLV